MPSLAGSLDWAAAARILAALALAFNALPVQAEAPLKTLPLRIASHALKVEVAESPPAREKGLMFREKLAANDGMLFIFDEPGYHSMWMMNTLIPLSVAFVDGGGKILSIHEMQPRTTDTHTAAGPARYAIETNAGWFAKKKIKPGDTVTGLPKVK